MATRPANNNQFTAEHFQLVSWSWAVLAFALRDSPALAAHYNSLETPWKGDRRIAAGFGFAHFPRVAAGRSGKTQWKS